MLRQKPLGICTLTVTVIALFFSMGCSDDNPNTPTGVTVEINSIPTVGMEGLPLVFSVVYSGAALSSARFEWDFGDGTPIDTVFNTGESTHVFSSSGSFTVTVHIFDNVAGSKYAEGSKVVTVNPFTNGFSIFSSATTGPEGTEITFTTVNTGSGIERTRYEWNFGDGTPIEKRVSDSTITHTFTTSGFFNVTCHVYDDIDNVSRAVPSKAITIAPATKPYQANYFRLKIRGEFEIHKVFHSTMGNNLDTIIVTDSIATACLSIFNYPVEYMRWNGQTLSCRVHVLPGSISRIKEMQADIRLSADGSAIEDILLTGSLAYNGASTQSKDTLAFHAVNIPLVSGINRDYAQYRVASTQMQSFITSLYYFSHTYVVSTSTEDLTFNQIKNGSSCSIDIELYQQWK